MEKTKQCLKVWEFAIPITSFFFFNKNPHAGLVALLKIHIASVTKQRLNTGQALPISFQQLDSKNI